MLFSKINLYFINQYSKYLLKSLVLFSALILILDFSEILRITAQYRSVSALEIIIMTLSKYFNNMTQLMHLVIFIGTASTFMALSKRNEMVIFTTLGISNYRIIINMIFVVFTVYLLFIFILLPINSSFSTFNQNIQKKLNSNGDTNIYLAENGIFFKNFSEEYLFIKADKMNKTAEKMINVNVWVLDKNFVLLRTIFAQHAVIKKSQLILHNPSIIKKDSAVNISEDVSLDFKISPKNIIKSLGSPEQINLFKIPSFITILADCGFSTSKYERYFYNNISMILNFLTMALIGFASTFNLVNRLFNKKNIIYGGICAFSMFFINDLIVTILLNQSYSIMFSVVITRIVLFSAISLYIENKYIQI
jgi:lipopolysaccharide export LptBFGC system permease protein LptF